MTESKAATRETSTGAKPKRALRSMTGYAQAQSIESGWTLRISIRSVNHRFLDLHVRVPDGFEPLEPRIRQIVRERVHRGHLDVTLYHELAGPAAVGVNEEVAAAYVEAVNSLRKKFEIKAEPDLASILRLPGVIGSPITSLDEQIERLEVVAARCLNDALDKLDRMRESEGQHLREEMSGRLRTIASHAARIGEIAERALPAFARRLEQRLKELLAESQMDATRLAQEAAIAAERSDVSEELARLDSHVQQFQTLLAGTSEVGKKLDFLLQEMQREINTLLSKTPSNEGDGLEITRLGLEVKSEIEKLREQVQNIE
ncbi:MAG TPA: YicC/YloC family endoribonuclease [Candidatus Acidoferrales bacterium]|nr:YicC/YloC family endoribonuclease [Candidatus Acidoferrales bacterium]